MISEKLWTKGQKSFVGTEHTNSKGNILSITGVARKDSRNVAVFSAICNKCTQDLELFPLGYFEVYKDNLLKGHFPCGCSQRHQYNKTQYNILVERQADSLGYEFLGFIGDWKNKHTKVSLFNPVTSNYWKSATIGTFLSGLKDPVISRNNTITANRLSVEYHTKGFKDTGAFPSGTKFNRVEAGTKGNRKSYWEVYCPICAKDEYSRAGLCYGTFKGYTGNLKLGNRPCRCSGKCKYTKPLLEFKIIKELEKDSYKLLHWEEGVKFSGIKSRVYCECPKGHNYSTLVYNLLLGKRCRECMFIKQRESGAYNGYFPDRVDKEDYLYVIDFGDYLKVGRSFDINERIHRKDIGLLKCSGKTEKDLTLLTTVTGSHQYIYDLEQNIHKQLKALGMRFYKESWSIELFCKESLSTILETLSSEETLKIY